MPGIDVEVLKRLRGACGHESVEEIAARTHCTNEEILIRLCELEAAGYLIERHPQFGVRLAGAPDRLIADDLQGMAEGLGLVREILVFEETTSTNDVAAQLGRQRARGGIVVFAESQTAGRGRLGRHWLSHARHGLWFSILLRPELAAEEWMRLTTWAAVGVARGIEEMASVDVEIKWPNDLQIAGRKVTGILLEAFREGQKGFAVAGIGVNVNQSEFPPEIEDRAISLRQAAGRAFDRQELAVSILRNLDATYGELGSRFANIVEEAGRRSCLVGRVVEIGSGAARVEGIFHGLSAEGAALIREPSGSIQTVSGGEVTVIWAGPAAAGSPVR